MSTYDGPSTVYINEESYNEADEYYDVSPERRRRRKSHDVTDSPASSHQSGSSLKSRDRPQGWSLHSLYTRLMKTFHRAWKEVRFSDHDPDDIELNVVRYKPDGIDALARTTKFSKKELQLMYRGFKAVSGRPCFHDSVLRYFSELSENFRGYGPRGRSNLDSLLNLLDQDQDPRLWGLVRRTCPTARGEDIEVTESFTYLGSVVHNSGLLYGHLARFPQDDPAHQVVSVRDNPRCRRPVG
ncbi:uncharacterized protein [Penaeus vannamei]|uniref:uncharacterized protein n=1 Tax=Penaeus vannamei TaxID=6689 RepID=UPI00387FA7D8